MLCDEKYFRGSFDFLPIVSQRRAAADPVQGLHHRPLPDLPGALLSGRRLPADALGARR
ncbi:hypothetical protein LN650_18985 [Klebsiella pneumoniae subsp. pneumoniae]|nr:hypothetical protein [Klebsiella pneumoniae subsp. pneumoniae]